MGFWKMSCGDSAWTTFGASAVTVLCILAPAVSMVEAQMLYTGHVAIVNFFSSPTYITCYSYLTSRQTYTAGHLDVYNISFDTAGGHRFWDCQVYNRGWGMVGVFRFYGDASHGGPQIWDCENCIWKVDQSGIYIYIDAMWQFKYHWPRIKTLHARRFN